MTPPTDPRELLKAFSAKTVTADQVMRGLTGHKGFYVPANFALDHFPQQVSDHTIILSQQFDVNIRQLVLFTDAIAAHRADGYPIGPFCGNFSGAAIFNALDARWEAVSINPCSPQEESWFIKREGFELAKMWGNVVAMDRLLVTEPASEVLYKLLANHIGFYILVNPEGQPLDITMPGIEGRSAIAFTAPDRFEAFVAGRSEEQRSRINKVAISGADLFRQLQQFDLGGLLLNVGPERGYIAKSEFARICSLAGAV